MRGSTVLRRRKMAANSAYDGDGRAPASASPTATMRAEKSGLYIRTRWHISTMLSRLSSARQIGRRRGSVIGQCRRLLSPRMKMLAGGRKSSLFRRYERIRVVNGTSSLTAAVTVDRSVGAATAGDVG